MAKLSTSEIKLVKSLSQKKFRDSLGLFAVEGEKMLGEAIQSGWDVVNVYRRDDIGEEQMRRISSLDSPSPVLAVLRKHRRTDAPIKSEGLYLALDGIRDPGNLGTVMRICDWFGIDGIYASQDTVDQYNPKVVQSSMGAIFRKDVIYGDLAHVIEQFRYAGMPVYGTFMDGDNLYESNIVPKGLIVMGNEARGVSGEIDRLCTSRLLIPSYASGPAHAESLNVAVATAVTVAEFKRVSIYVK